MKHAFFVKKERKKKKTDLFWVLGAWREGVELVVGVRGKSPWPKVSTPFKLDLYVLLNSNKSTAICLIQKAFRLRVPFHIFLLWLLRYYVTNIRKNKKLNHISPPSLSGNLTLLRDPLPITSFSHPPRSLFCMFTVGSSRSYFSRTILSIIFSLCSPFYRFAVESSHEGISR